MVRGGYFGRYVPSGHLVYVQQGTVFGIRFDLSRLETIGQAVPVLEGVATSTTTGGAQLALSADGTLVYVPGGEGSPKQSVEWLTQEGRTSVLRGTKADWANLRFSPDGQKLALDINSDGKQRDLWVYEWARDAMTQLTFDPGTDIVPIWTPDGRRLVFGSDRAKPRITNLYWVNADGTGDVTRLTDSPASQLAYSWHPSGKFLAFYENAGPPDGWNLMILPLEGDTVRGWTPDKPTLFLGTPATEVLPVFSPDGRWIAYQSNESGAFEVYVRPFPGPGGKWRISTEGGNDPRWSRKTPELLFTNQAQVFVASYTVVGDSFRADKPKEWSSTRIQSIYYDIHPDGKRLAASAAADQTGVLQDRVVFMSNFFEYLHKIVPSGSGR